MKELISTYRPYFRAASWVVLAVLAYYVVSQTRAALNAPAPQIKEEKPAVSLTVAGQAGKKAAKPKSTPKAARIGEIKVIVNGALNIRAAADRQSPEIGSAPGGSKLSVLGKEGSWYKVIGPKGEKGYVTASTRYVQVLWMK